MHMHLIKRSRSPEFLTCWNDSKFSRTQLDTLFPIWDTWFRDMITWPSQCISMAVAMQLSMWTIHVYALRGHSVNVPRQWEMLHCNVISHWVDTYTKWSLCPTIVRCWLNKFRYFVFMFLCHKSIWMILLGSCAIFQNVWRIQSGVSYWHFLNISSVNGLLLMAPSHYLNQYWLIIDEVHWNSSDGQACTSTRSTKGISIKFKIW